jgi:DNA-directed RNA polymerase specialized sigma24 family protein
MHDENSTVGLSVSESKSLSNLDLFRHCAQHLGDEACWDEFLRRYQRLIVRSVSCAYRRFMHGEYAPPWRTSELAQEVYLRLLKDDCALLRRFQGVTENSAEAYLAQVALNTAGDVLRREAAMKRQGEVASIDETPELEVAGPRIQKFSLPAALAERELIRILARTGGEWQRDTLIFLLHLQLGLTVKEIVRTNLFALQPTTVFGILVRVRSRLADAHTAGRI